MPSLNNQIFPANAEKMKACKNKKPRKNIPPSRKTPTLSSYKKKGIPAALKAAVWMTYNGTNFEAKCHVSWCKSKLTVFNFEAGHDIPESKGGATCLDNLRPICASCNKSMGNLYTISEFSKLYMHKEKRSWIQRWFCFH